MHIEPPDHAPRTLRDFLSHYALIVLSILTALALEQVVLAVHDRDAAHASRIRIEAEIAANSTDVGNTIRFNQANLDALKSVFDQLVPLIRDQSATSATAITMLQRAGTLFSIQFPTLRREAFDAAIADQSAIHMDADALHRYSEIYSAQQDMVNAEQVLLGGNLLDEGADMAFAFKLKQLDPSQAARLIAHFIITEMTAQGELRGLQQLLTREAGVLPPRTIGGVQPRP